jgi:hypothetical protein
VKVPDVSTPEKIRTTDDAKTLGFEAAPEQVNTRE